MLPLIAIIALAGIFAFWLRANSGMGGRNVIVEAEREVDLREEKRYRMEKHTVGVGDTWGKIARDFLKDSALSASLLDASKEAHDLASIRQGNEFRFVFEEGTEDFVRVEYDINDEEFLSVERQATGKFNIKVQEIPYEITLTRKEGIIESSLFETARAEGIPAGIILDLARVFSWDVDFASSVQAGDSFVMVYEERFLEGKPAKPGKVLTARFVNSGREFLAFFFQSSAGESEYYNEEGRALRRQFLRSPLDYTRITSSFSYNRFHPILQTFTTHRAIDYAASAGTPVSATADGQITYVGWNGGNGKYVGIRHENGYSTGYAHLSAYGKGIKNGAWEKQNDVIGFVGSTGLSTGPHLHYEMRKNGALINPLRLDLPPGKVIKEEHLEDFFKERDHLLGLLGE